MKSKNFGRGIPSLKIDVNLVLLNATVTGQRHRLITNLEKDNFLVFEDRIQQQISYFSRENVPASIAVSMDVSGSMAGGISLAKETLGSFLRTGNEGSEYLLITFSDSPEVDINFTSAPSEIERGIAFKVAGGSTSLYDAIYLASANMAKAHHQRKAIVVVTDGEDNNSRYTADDVCDAIKESGIEIYPIVVSSSWNGEQNDNDSLALMKMARISGGKVCFPRFLDQVSRTCTEIAQELNSQYLLGYYSSNRNQDRTWRRVSVKIKTSGASRLSIRTKLGYYARE